MMHYATINGVEIAYELIGTSGPWLALLSGGRRSYADLKPLAELIAGNDFQVLLHDRRNTGLSGFALGNGVNEEDIWADDLAALLRHLQISSAFVGGFSTGARLSIRFAIRHPEMARGVLLARLSGGLAADARLPGAYYGVYIDAARTGGMAAVAKAGHYADRAPRDDRSDDLLDLDPDLYALQMAIWKESFIGDSPSPVFGLTESQLSQVRCPALLIPGNDHVHSLDATLTAARSMPNAEVYYIAAPPTDIDFIPLSEWMKYYPEISEKFKSFSASL